LLLERDELLTDPRKLRQLGELIVKGFLAQTTSTRRWIGLQVLERNGSSPENRSTEENGTAGIWR
jgi:hypothetical protein